MDQRLIGRTAIVTGASRGIGEATARALDRAGARVALVSRNAEELERVATTLRNNPVCIAADLAESDAPAAVAQQALVALGAVDILVNSAGTAVRMDTVDLTAEMIDSVFALNVRATLLLIAALIPTMTERGGGAIINMSSVTGLVGTPRRAAYAATKGAIDAATRSLAMELGPLGIRVNAVAPGVVDTALWAANKAIPGVIEEIESQTPLRRWAVPEDIADMIVVLASNDARFVTGETISVDGGMARTFDLYGGKV